MHIHRASYIPCGVAQLGVKNSGSRNKKCEKPNDLWGKFFYFVQKAQQGRATMLSLLDLRV